MSLIAPVEGEIRSRLEIKYMVKAKTALKALLIPPFRVGVDACGYLRPFQEGGCSKILRLKVNSIGRKRCYSEKSGVIQWLGRETPILMKAILEVLPRRSGKWGMLT